MIKRQPTGLRIIPEKYRSLSIRALWRMGYDTTDIAVAHNRSEASVYNILSRDREAIHETKKSQSASSG